MGISNFTCSKGVSRPTDAFFFKQKAALTNTIEEVQSQ